MSTIFTEATLDVELGKFFIICTEANSGISMSITVPVNAAMGASKVIDMMSKRMPSAYVQGVTMVMESEQDG